MTDRASLYPTGHPPADLEALTERRAELREEIERKADEILAIREMLISAAERAPGPSCVAHLRAIVTAARQALGEIERTAATIETIDWVESNVIVGGATRVAASEVTP